MCALRLLFGVPNTHLQKLFIMHHMVGNLRMFFQSFLIAQYPAAPRVHRHCTGVQTNRETIMNRTDKGGPACPFSSADISGEARTCRSTNS